MVKYKVMEGRSFSEKLGRYKGELLLCVLAAVLLVPNVMNLFVYSVESAEAFSVKMGNMTLQEMLHATANEIHPPLYYAMLQVWIAVFGNTGVAYRFLSLIPYLITMAYALAFLRKEFGYFCSAVFMTFSSLVTTALIYNTHIRNYSWPAFCVLMCYHELYLILRDGRRRNYILLALFAALSGYLLYYALLPAGLCYLFLLFVLLFEKKKEQLKNWGISALLAIAIYAPWLVVFFRTWQSLGGWYWMQEVDPFSDFYKSIFSARFSAVWPTLWLLLAAYLLFREHREAPRPEEKSDAREVISRDTMWILAGVFVVFGTIAVGFLVSVLVRPLFNPRYLYPAVPVAWLSLAAGAKKLKQKKIIVPVFLAVFLVLQFQTFFYMRQRRQAEDEKTRATVQAVTERDVNGAVLLSEEPLGSWDDQIILNLGFMPAPMTEYYFRGMSEEVRIDPAAPEQWELPEGKRCVLFVREALPGEAVQVLKNRGYDCECLTETGFICFWEYVVYDLMPR